MAKKTNTELKAFAKQYQIGIDNEFQNPCIVNGHIIIVKPIHINSTNTLEESICRLVRYDVEGGTE